MLSFSEAYDFLQAVMNQFIQMSTWNSYVFEVTGGDPHGRELTGKLYYDGTYLRIENYSMNNGFSEDGNNVHWRIVPAPIMSKPKDLEPLPDWKIWDNFRQDTKDRQEQLMRDLRKRRIKEDSDENR